MSDPTRERLPALSLFLVFVCQFAVSAAAQSVRADESRTSVSLRVGEQHIIDISGIRTYSEGTSGVVDLRPTREGAELVIVALRPGFTSLLLLPRSGQPRMLSIDVKPRERAVAAEQRALVEVRRNVRLDLYFVQLDTNFRQRVGTSWQQLGVSADLNARYAVADLAVSNGASAVLGARALPTLDLAEVQGWAKIMRRAALITGDGQRGQFNSGGEFNLQVAGALAGAVHTIEYGSMLAVLPRYDEESGRLQLDIEAEVSDLAAEQGGGVPGRHRSRVQTSVQLELGQSLMLAGLSSVSAGESVDGLPWLSRIPVLGALFGSSDQREQQVESVIFIVPSLIQPVTTGTLRQVDEALRLFERYDGDIARGVLSDSVTPASAGEAR